MSAQLTLDDALARRDDVLARLQDAASSEWQRAAYAAVVACAFDRGADGFIADDIWEYLERPANPKALGAVLMKLAREKRILATGEWRPHPRRHATKTQVWRLA